MSKTFKASVLILALITLCVFSAFSTKVSYRFKYVGETEIDCFEYRFQDNNWKTIDKDQHKMVFSMSDNEARALKEDSFQIRSKKDDRVSVDVNGIPVRHNHAFNVSGVPYALQISTESKNNKTVTSKNGLGAELSYQYFFFNNFYTTVGAQWSLFWYEEDSQPTLNSIVGFGGFGYRFDIIEKLKIYTDITAGCDFQIADNTLAEVVSYMANAGVEYNITDILSAKLSCRGVFEYSIYNDVTYLDFKILPSLGMSVRVR